MLKKICIFLCVMISTFSMVSAWACKDDQWQDIPCPKCSYNFENGAGEDIRSKIDGCVQWSDLIQKSNAKIDSWFKTTLIDWIKKIRWYLALGAIFAIVLGSFQFTLSMGEEEKITKAKDIIKWGVLWLIAILAAGLLIQVVVEIIYKLW